MKRIVTLLLSAALVLGATMSASAATTFNASGTADFVFEYRNGTDFDDTKKSDPLNFAQDFQTRLQFNSGDVSGQMTFVVGGFWGKKNDGLALGADAINVKTREAFINFKVPSTNVAVRLGLQTLYLPSAIPGIGNPVMGIGNLAGVSLNAPINEYVSVSAFWARAVDMDTASSNKSDPVTGLDLNNRYDEFDLFGLLVPVKYKNYFNVTPWGMVGQLGSRAAVNLASQTPVGPHSRAMQGMLPVHNVPSTDPSMAFVANDKKQATPFWLGLPLTISYFDPFAINLDVNYGTNGLNNSQKRSGWYVAGQVSYKMPKFVPSIAAWWTSGDDSNPYNGSEMMPYLTGDNAFTQFGMGLQPMGVYAAAAVTSQKTMGTWGVRAQVADITFIENLKHTLRVAYYQGTNSGAKRNVEVVGTPTRFINPLYVAANTYMTEDDSAFEINFLNSYKIYENLTLFADFNMIFANFDKNTWSKNNSAAVDFKDRNLYSISTGIKYVF